MSDAPILQTARNPIGEWSDTNNIIVDQSKVEKMTKSENLLFLFEKKK